MAENTFWLILADLSQKPDRHFSLADLDQATLNLLKNTSRDHCRQKKSNFVGQCNHQKIRNLRSNNGQFYRHISIHLSQYHSIIIHIRNIEMKSYHHFTWTSAFVNVAYQGISQVCRKNRAKVIKETKRKTRVVSWNIVVVSSVANVVVSCLLCRQQEHAGLNPTESMTRALISDDNIARQSALGPVQLGYVLPLLVTPPIPVMLNPKNPKSWMSPGIVGPIIDSPNKTTRSNDATIRRSKNLNTSELCI